MTNAYEKRGFQRTFLNDIYHVEERLQEYDPQLYLMWNPKNGEHVIMDGLLEMSIMKIPQIGFEQLDTKVVDHIKRIHTVNGFSAVQTVEDTEKKRQQEQERQLQDLVEDYAKESKEAFWNAHAYGRVDGVQKYVQGVNMGRDHRESARANPASEPGCG
ncbi:MULTISPECIES: 2,3-dihydroxybenzoate--AMP ligase [Bacillus cereus group]|uniref:2,3-dihydroxybenzoate--AMP ligase n=1 Tax=Bacillus cereus TaxID=1396 RepID=A0AAW5L8G1_BACCE|nr:2,3-dihydroxybenzoate--AMP ligase [Bacillus cereus]MCQ6289101.1 2,3-dihydroxybenzoate--AMP ligase [Bacillus cereus]MCQ6318578.1 2,3-dihydroxybenzoate--AMP ligase [Bacillus cereus]MCQ6330766.1 2,3-dihydroxybenzoate--AMP ligase [Bacillus cereus]MCQ6386142.1 2,3-dihydroxybenzoate--AMP ligase [Bacillus cereus]HDW3056407.1 2,3-dihydroxybenzoate--AMP ligase [Bacillus cereus]